MSLATGVFFMLEYPADTIGEDGLPVKVNVLPDGTLLSNYEVALRIRQDLINGIGVVVPNDFSKYAEQVLTQNITDLAKVQSWKITFPDTRSAHGEDFERLMKLLDGYIFSGLAVPPRAGLEAQHGSKADSESHTASGVITASEFFIAKLLRTVIQPIIDTLLVQNFGEDARGAVWAEVKPLIDEKLKFVQDMLLKAFSNPSGGMQLFMECIDVMGNLEKCGAETLKFDQQKLKESLVAMKAVGPDGKSVKPGGKPTTDSQADASDGDDDAPEVADLSSDTIDAQVAERQKRDRDLLALLAFFVWQEEAIIEDGRIDRARHDRRLTSVLSRLMMPPAIAGAMRPNDAHGVLPDGVRSAVEEEVNTQARRLATLINDTTERRVNEVVPSSQPIDVNEGGELPRVLTPDEIRKAIEPITDKSVATRAEIILGDTLHIGGQSGNRARSEVDQKWLQWHTEHDDSVCHLCSPLDGKTAPAGGEFAPMIRVPTIDTHGGCRCWLEEIDAPEIEK
jgi:hypothetical protein